MNNRARIINNVLMKKIDRQPLAFYFGPWGETIERWEKEGLAEGSSWDTGLDLDAGIRHVNVNLGYCPAFKREIIEEKKDTYLIRNELGILEEVLKSGSTIPRIIETPVKDWESWEKLKAERLNPGSPERFPPDWDKLAGKYNESDYVIKLGWFPYGLFGTLRDMLGVETLLLTFFDDPDLIHDMMDYLTNFWLAIYEKVCRKAEVHAIHMWEDMSGKNGSLISPQMVREFMMPNYQKIAAFAREHNIPIFSLDTDGDCSQLVPLFLESGINLVFPFEVAAGCDVNEYRKRYPNLCIMGGIDKREIAKGPQAIERELDRIDPMLKGPGYWPALDHLIHPEISYNDFKYFVASLRERVERHGSKT
jgi:uroporphyrinogen decarboxylase